MSHDPQGWFGPDEYPHRGACDAGTTCDKIMASGACYSQECEHHRPQGPSPALPPTMTRDDDRPVFGPGWAATPDPATLGASHEVLPTPGVVPNGSVVTPPTYESGLPGLALLLKDGNPKDAVGSRKVSVSCVPQQVIGEIGLALTEGALKYGRHNYRVAGVRASVYFDAAWRHLAAWWEGEDLDPDSGLSHVTKAMAGLAVLRDSMIRGNWNDDRPPRLGPQWVQALNLKAAEVIGKFPEPKPPHTQQS